jgi:hypothetical protein
MSASSSGTMASVGSVARASSLVTQGSPHTIHFPFLVWDDVPTHERCTVIGLVIGHIPCALDHQRRLREAQAARVARAMRPGRRPRPTIPSPGDLSRPLGEDVWQALRF